MKVPCEARLPFTATDGNVDFFECEFLQGHDGTHGACVGDMSERRWAAPVPGIPREEIAQLVRDAVAKEREAIIALLQEDPDVVSAREFDDAGACLAAVAAAIRARGAK